MTTRQDAPAPAPSVRPVMLLRMVLWFGVLTGFAELGYLVYKKVVEQQFVWVSREVVWMAPLGNVGYFAVAGLLLLVVRRFRPTAQAVTFTFTWLALVCVLALFAVVHPLASVVLSAGVAMQIGKIVAKHTAGFEAMVGRTSTLLVGLVVLLALGDLGWQWMGRSGVDKAARAGAPNVLLITMDTVRAQSLSLNGYERKTTPQLDKLAARGLVFDWAIAPASWTLLTHASLFTGEFPNDLSVDWMAPLDDAKPTLAEAMRNHGYATGGFASNLNYCGAEVGLARGFTHYQDYPVSLGQVVLSTALGRLVTNSGMLRRWLDWHENLNRKTADDVSGEFLSWLDGIGDQPFFAFVNYYDAHQPYLPPAEWADKFGALLPRVGFRYDTNLIEIEDWYRLSREQVQSEENAYCAAIAYLDDRIGKLVDVLERRKLLDNTLVVITSDHGEQFGEHDMYNHGNSLYVQGLHVPLLILFPGGERAGTSVNESVSLRDVAATILEQVGIEADGLVGGASLSRYWGVGDTTAAKMLLSEVRVLDAGRRSGDTRSLVVGKLHFIKNGDGSTELYDLGSDPSEKHDLAALPNSRGAIEKFEKALEMVLKK